MATINLGSIKFKWQGAYAGGTAYTVDDVVSYQGSSYICIQASTGNLPTNATYWEQMSQKGTDADLLNIASTAQGDLYYNNGSAIARLPAGSANQVLQTGGTGANPSWVDVSGGVNTPCFRAVRTSNQSFTSATNTKVQCDVETFDVGSAYDSTTNFRFTPPAGKYLIGGGTHAFGGNGVAYYFRVMIYKNGSVLYPDHLISGFGNSGNEQGSNTSVLDIANGTDYYELYMYLAGGSGNIYNSAFWGFKIIE